MCGITNQANDPALAAFVARKDEIDTMLARLRVLSDEHFGCMPDAVTWADVGTLGHYADLLRRLTDADFSEGDCAA